MRKKKKKTSRSVIQLTDNYQGPKAICQHCKNVMIMDIEPFKKDITLPIESSCPRCGGTIYSILLILTQTSLPGLIQNIRTIVELFEAGKGNVLEV